jgi:prepilin-type N-terminal cleavage/methylation domain-containing protein
MKSSRAFSLLEVVMALLIIAIVSLAVSTTLISGSRSNANNRERARAAAAAEAWLDRFRSYSLPFNAFVGGRDYDYGYDYTRDPIITASGDPNIAEITSEWGDFKFHVETYQFSSNPVLWRIKVTAYYKYKREKGGNEERVELVTIR